MRSDLPAVSFVCAILLALFIPVPRVRGNITNLALVAWLVGCNIVHGINALVWADNVDIHIPVWCDIVTKLLLGATVALPGACLSISWQLERVSSNRPIPHDLKSQRNSALIEFLFCYIIPLIYMLIHFISQDHRFDIVKDFGCSASIHPSTPALTIMALPPIIVCISSFAFLGFTTNHAFRHTSVQFSAHLESRSNYTSSTFLRRLIMSLFLTAVIFVVALFSSFSTSNFLPWDSWASVHANMWVVSIVGPLDDVAPIKLVWWGVHGISIGYLLLLFTIGEETRDIVKWIRRGFSSIQKRRRASLSDVLPVHVEKFQDLSLGAPQSRRLALEPYSGWDEMLEVKPQSPGKKTSGLSATAPPPSPKPGSSVSPNSDSTSAEDEAFIVDTMNYLGSPVAKSLGITPPSSLQSLPSIYVSPIKDTHDNPFADSSPIPSLVRNHTHNTPPSPLRVPDDVDGQSIISSVFDASWPEPPVSPPSTAASSRHSLHSPTPLRRSATTAAAAATELRFGHPLYPTATPPQKRSQPFQGPGVSVVGNMPRRPSRAGVKGVKRVWSKEKVREEDVIYMTVVKQVV